MLRSVPCSLLRRVGCRVQIKCGPKGAEAHARTVKVLNNLLMTSNGVELKCWHATTEEGKEAEAQLAGLVSQDAKEKDMEKRKEILAQARDTCQKLDALRTKRFVESSPEEQVALRAARRKCVARRTRFFPSRHHIAGAAAAGAVPRG